MAGDAATPGSPSSGVRRPARSADGSRWNGRSTPSPDLEWTEVFQLTEIQDREGPVDWTQGGGPDVVGSTLRWFVPVDNLEDAEAEVAHRLEVANRRRFGPAGTGA